MTLLLPYCTPVTTLLLKIGPQSSVCLLSGGSENCRCETKGTVDVGPLKALPARKEGSPSAYTPPSLAQPACSVCHGLRAASAKLQQQNPQRSETVAERDFGPAGEILLLLLELRDAAVEDRRRTVLRGWAPSRYQKRMKVELDLTLKVKRSTAVTSVI